MITVIKNECVCVLAHTRTHVCLPACLFLCECYILLRLDDSLLVDALKPSLAKGVQSQDKWWQYVYGGADCPYVSSFI